MNMVTEYLNRVLGINAIYKNEVEDNLPNFICARYYLKLVELERKEVVFVFPKNELEPVNTVKKHIERINQTVGTIAVLVPQKLTYRYKEYLIRDHIPFIVDKKQIYLPFLAVYLQERCDDYTVPTGNILPSAQMLLLHYIYKGCGTLQLSEATKALGLSAMSVSRASRQLNEMNILKLRLKGVSNYLISEKKPRELYELAQKVLVNPVKRTIYVKKSEIKESLLLSGYSALSEYSMINPSKIEYFAANSVANLKQAKSNILENADDQCAVELWRYDPAKLFGSECVDPLSLALSLRNDHDERTEEAVGKMLKQVWRDIDGKRY